MGRYWGLLVWGWREGGREGEREGGRVRGRTKEMRAGIAADAWGHGSAAVGGGCDGGGSAGKRVC